MTSVAEKNEALFTKRLYDALRHARSGQVALVIVPGPQYTVPVMAFLGQQLDSRVDTNARSTPDALHFQGHAGSVRVYPANHVTWDQKNKRLRDYPAGLTYFLHPDVELT